MIIIVVYNFSFVITYILMAHSFKVEIRATRMHSSRMRTARSLTVSCSIQGRGGSVQTPTLDADYPGCTPNPPLVKRMTDRQV